MKRKLSIKKGLDLRLAGEAPFASDSLPEIAPRRVGVVPDDFPGLSLKACVGEGDTVSAGQPLLNDKKFPSLSVCSPAAGTVQAVVRGERRRIERVVVELDGGDGCVGIDTSDPKEALMRSGLWALMRQRPFDIVPGPDVEPRDIFVNGLDTAPLAISPARHIAALTDDLERGVDVLAAMTRGRVWVSLPPGCGIGDIRGAEIVEVTGPHPAGNVGVQIANIAPVNKGETVWALDIVTLARIGRLFNKGVADFATHVAVTGPEIREPKVVRTVIGAEIAPLLHHNIADDRRRHRIISGNVLTGFKVPLDGFLRYPYRQITVIAEGDDTDEFMGWASMSPSKLSASRSFPSWFMGKRRFSPDARLLGGRRAMIMSGLYDKVFPMDIMPEFLVKAVIARDIEKMEALGIYEVAPEDFALAEFIDPSKIELQKLVAGGLEYMRKEL